MSHGIRRFGIYVISILIVFGGSKSSRSEDEQASLPEGLLKYYEHIHSYRLTISEEAVSNSGLNGKEHIDYLIISDIDGRRLRFDKNDGSRQLHFIRTPDATFFKSGRVGPVTHGNPDRAVPLVDAKPFDPLLVPLMDSGEYQRRITHDAFVNYLKAEHLVKGANNNGSSSQLAWQYSFETDGNKHLIERQVSFDTDQEHVPIKVVWKHTVCDSNNKELGSRIEETNGTKWGKVNGVLVPLTVEMNAPFGKNIRTVLTYSWHDLNTKLSEDYFSPTDFTFSQPTPLLNVTTDPPYIEIQDISK